MQTHTIKTSAPSFKIIVWLFRRLGEFRCFGSVLTFSLTSSETVRESIRQETAQLMMWNRVYITRVLVDDLTGGQKAQQSEHGAGPQQQHI